MKTQCILRTPRSFGLFSGIAAVLVTSTALATPFAPPVPAMGYLYDGYDSNTNPAVIDDFGLNNGTAVATLQALPSASIDTPFSYSGNQSLERLVSVDIPPNHDNGVTYGAGSFASTLNGASAVTFQAWVKPLAGTVLGSQSASNRIFVGFIDSGSAAWNVRVNADGNVVAAARSNPGGTLFTSASTASISIGQWNQIVTVFDYAAKETRISVNGGAFEVFSTNFNTDTLTVGTATTADVLPYVETNTSRNFSGLFDEVGLWGTALTQDNVEWLNQFSLSSVPEPNSMVLVTCGALALIGSCRFRRRR